MKTTKFQDITFAVGTWNMGGNKAQDKLDLNEWFLKHDDPDLVVMGF